MKPRIRAVLPDGADGPVLNPHYDNSRVHTLADYMSTDRGITIFWQSGHNHRRNRPSASRSFAGKGKAGKSKGPGEKAKPFGDILELHARGLVRNAPVRDVRLSAANIAQVKLKAVKAWRARLASRPKPTPKPKPRPQPQPAPSRLPTRRPAPGIAARPVISPHAVPLPATTRPVAMRPAPSLPGDTSRPMAVPLRPVRPGQPHTQAAVEKTLGVKFVPSYHAEGRDTVVMVDVARLDAALAQDAGFHVGQGGTGPSSKPGAYTNAKAYLAQSMTTDAPFEMPRMGIDATGSPTVIDGRHRLAALRDSGVRFAPVTVPRTSAKRFEDLYGAK